MFQGQAPPFSTISRLPPSPVGCAVVVLAPSVGFITNLLVKTSQGRISKFITRSFFRINKFSHIVISLLPVKFFNNLNPVPKLLKNLTGRSEMTMWENLLILKNKERVMNFEIAPCDVLTSRFVIKQREGARTTTAHPTDGSSRDMVENGDACP